MPNVGKRILSRIFGKGKSSQDYSEALEDLSADTITSQKSVDTEHPAFFLPDEHLVIPPFDQIKYLDLYLTDSLSKALIDADTNLTVSPIECVSENDDLCGYIDEFNRRIDLDSMTWQLCRDANLMGFGLCEIVGNARTLLDSTAILGLKRLDPRFILIQKQGGHFKFFRQRPGLLRNALSVANFQGTKAFPMSFDTPLDPQSIIFVRNWSPLTSYGHSMLQSLMERLTQRNQLIDAAVLSFRNHSNPTNHLHYAVPPDLPHDDDEVKKQRKSLRQQTVKIDKGESRWLISGGRGEYVSKLIGHTTLPDVTALLDRLTAEIIISAGHSPTQLGFNVGARGANQNDPSARMTINSILTKQRNLVQQLQNKLYRILPLIESGTPQGDIRIRMQEPTAESAKEKAEEQTIRINNAILEGKAGIISGSTAAKSLGYDALEDQERWNTLTEPQLDQVNQNDPNQNQAVRSAIDTTTKGNNPNGNK